MAQPDPVRTVFKNLGLVVASSLATGLFVVAAFVPGGLGATAPPLPALGVSPVSAQAAPASAEAPVQVYQQNAASVVNITSQAVARSIRGGTQQTQGVGSGFILDTEGRIVTNNHVVQDAQQLTVTLQDRTTVPAKLLGRDEPNDLAVIQVDPNATDDQGRPIRDRLKPASLGDSDAIRIGEQVIAIGSPLGLQQSVSAGIVSAVRSPGEGAGANQVDLLAGAVQTDAAINPGNSGGPLFNARGEVIGVNTAILSQSGGNEGIGFAIPINVVKRIAPVLSSGGTYAHPQVGVTALALSQLGQATKDQLGVAANQKGLLMQEVTAGAAQAGLRAGSRTVAVGGEQVRAGGDIVVAVDGRPLVTSGDLRGYIENNKRPGDSITLSVLRDGQRLDLSVMLTERPAQAATAAPAPAPAAPGH